jgi:very-short-patch-repair endonuclease
MAGINGQSPGIRRILRRQHGVITRAQLLDLGLTKSGISHRLRTKRLRRLHRGVFVIGGREIRRLERMAAAVLACGQGALLSHDTAAELWGIPRTRGGPIEVTVPAGSRHRPRGIRVHRRGGLTHLDRRVHLGIPVTRPARTLADLAPRLSPAHLESAINEADRLDLIDPGRLRQAMEEMRGQPGAGTILHLLDRQVFRLTDSELERTFLRLVRKAGLPAPQTRVQLHGFRVDFFWSNLGLVVETDGLRYHRTASQQVRDRRRDQVHTAAGLTTLRFTHAQVQYESADVIDVLTRVIAGLVARRAAA